MVVVLVVRVLVVRMVVPITSHRMHVESGGSRLSQPRRGEAEVVQEVACPFCEKIERRLAPDPARAGRSRKGSVSFLRYICRRF